MNQRSEPTDHRIIWGDSRNVLPGLGDDSVDLVVTSPPYWQLKDYGVPGQIGTGQEYPDYLASLRTVWRECHRLLRPGCRMAVNIGDQYLRASRYGRYRVQPIPADTIMACREIGLDFMGNIVWRKVSTTNTSGGGVWMGSAYHPKDGHVTYEHEYILLFRKLGNWKAPSADAKERSRLTKRQRSEWFRGYWELTPERQNDHVAKFPVELPERLIRMYTFVGETVLDPFLGSGTTCLAASRAGRNSVGVETNPEFRPVMTRRLGVEQGLFGGIEREGENETYRDENRVIRWSIGSNRQIKSAAVA